MSHNQHVTAGGPEARRIAQTILEPRHFTEFRCIGAECEDTCCDGWAVGVDKPTYEKYRDFADPKWRSAFEQLVIIRPADATDQDYARIQLDNSRCPFLSEGLCRIHKELGEDYLPLACATFPRVWNVVDQVLEISLDMACPEAARVALLKPEPMSFQEKPIDAMHSRWLSGGFVDTSNTDYPGKPYAYLPMSRAFVVRLLQHRALPVWKRLLILGFFCEKLQETASGHDGSQIPKLIAAFDQAIAAGAFDVVLDQLSAPLQLRLETVVEIILARITSDFTHRRFLESYKEFMEGLEWGTDTSMQQLSARYLALRERYYRPFLDAHSYILEHYLMNYVQRSLFPFGPQETTYSLGVRRVRRSIRDAYMLLAVQYAIVETLLIGLTGFYREAFSPEHAIRVISASTRTFEHSLTFSEHLLQALEAKRLNSVQGAAVLIKG